MNNYRWMVCTQCKQTVQQNATAICLMCQRVFTEVNQPDSWKNINRCKSCGSDVSTIDGRCGSCNDSECGDSPHIFEQELVKCKACGLVHVVVESGGRTKCFRCDQEANIMVPAILKDVPRGSTLQPVNREAICRKR